VEQYPHELSGGMKQRAMIAMALACNPDLLIADEPTTALDVTIQAQIIELLAELQDELGMAILLITHNLGVVAHFARRVTVMYAGMVAERSDVKTLFGAPRHPYTLALLDSLPNPAKPYERLSAIAGSVPAAHEFPAGCRFSTRCPRAIDGCHDQAPRLRTHGATHEVACWLYDDPESARPGAEPRDTRE
jgi:oligopeptide/dipeptide ABC transporter ATP-binding protein